jgi:hypothetical protein
MSVFAIIELVDERNLPKVPWFDWLMEDMQFPWLIK